MKDFLSVNIDAEELMRHLGRMGELRARARPIPHQEIGRSLLPDQLRAVWTNGRRLTAELPSILLASENVLSGFLPRILALPGGVTPVTSIMKTWLIEDFTNISLFDEKPLSNTAALGFVGLIIGELLTTAGADADLRLVGADGVRRTLSFVCAQAIVKGWRSASLAKIVERWLEASALTGNEVNVEARVKIANMCGFLQALSDLDEPDGSAPPVLARQVQSWIEGQGDPNQRDLLRRPLPQVAHSLAGVSSREKRFDIVMEVLQNSAHNEVHDPLERGFLISLIEPGSFEFLELSKRFDTGDGSISTAYCVFTVILGKEAALRQFNGFGWAVLSHSLQLDADIRSDISITELRILRDPRRTTPILFRTRSPWLIDVELAPMVSGSFGNVAKRRASSERLEERSDVAEREELLRENLGTALRALENAYGIVEGKRPRQDSKGSTQRRPRSGR